ncbi:hypothetical protein Prudu_005142 [Prunus dulcis]|uniref:Pentatricopeptide repeat-containing protein n=1 Tax=Prunus dulcis TaxID=3755 RepID=A0A4Y1QX24_PRUDU|nr:hypothetical protein Prudu_005142 [Prunus dulcis]
MALDEELLLTNWSILELLQPQMWKMINASHEVSWHSAESITRSIQMQIVDALRLGERSKASNQLLNLGCGNDLLRADDFVYILNYRAKSPDPLFVMETWRIMDEKEISLNNICSLLMVHALCKGGYLEEAFKLINFLGESPGIYPVLPIYNSFLRACAKMQSIINANQCLDLMERQMVGMGKNEVTYSELLKFGSKTCLLPMKFGRIISNTTVGDLKSAYEKLQYMVALAIRGNTYVNKTSEGKLYLSRLDIPIPSTCELNLKKLDLEENNILFLPYTVRIWMTMLLMQISALLLAWELEKKIDVIHPCARLRNGGLAEELILQMQKFGLQPSSHTYDGFVRAVTSERGFSSGMEIESDWFIVEANHLKKTDLAIVGNHSRMLQIYLRIGVHDVVRWLLSTNSDLYHSHKEKIIRQNHS